MLDLSSFTDPPLPYSIWKVGYESPFQPTIMIPPANPANPANPAIPANPSSHLAALKFRKGRSVIVGNPRTPSHIYGTETVAGFDARFWRQLESNPVSGRPTIHRG